ncbi:MAG: DUF222 domain-containing protein [Marmoricola sp.]
MFDTSSARPSSEGTSAREVAGWIEDLRHLERKLSDPGRIDLLRLLEELKSAAAAAQAVTSVDFDASQRAEQADAGVPAAELGRGVGAQVALARRDSAHRGGRHLGLAVALVREMPFTLAALTYGRISEWRATLLVRETACLSREDRAQVDVEMCADLERVASYGDRQLVAEARRLAYRLDAESVVRRARRATSDRRVTVRPAPDTMSYLTGLLPVAQGVAVYAALKGVADSLTATGDGRTRGQIMADTLVERVTGQASPEQVPVMVHLVMTDDALLGADDEPAHLGGHGVIPAGIARDLVGNAQRTWIRRLFSSPETGELVAMDSRARIFPAALARLLRLRDQVCRTPWCEASIRHHDHVVAHQFGGPTSSSNGQALCEACNHTKQALGWRARPRPGPVHTVETTTPTGHTYLSIPPELPGQTRRWVPAEQPGVWTAA